MKVEDGSRFPLSNVLVWKGFTINTEWASLTLGKQQLNPKKKHDNYITCNILTLGKEIILPAKQLNPK